MYYDLVIFSSYGDEKRKTHSMTTRTVHRNANRLMIAERQTCVVLLEVLLVVIIVASIRTCIKHEEKVN